MRILYCVQRYGPGVAGGAEVACRNLAERMARRGHEVEVLTTCALDYNDWADHFDPGTSVIDGVAVHRVPVRAPRDPEAFGPLHARVTASPRTCLAVERDWLRVLGPDSPQLLDWLAREGQRFDVAVFYTYLYAPSGFGIRIASESVPVLLHPAAHDETAWWLSVYRPMLDGCSGFAFHTPEERGLADQRGQFTSDVEMLGMGVDVDIVGDGDRFRREFDLGGDPIVMFLGRIDPGKGPDELYHYMTHLIDAGRTDARFVVVGKPVVELPEHPGVVFTGFVDERTKADALAASNVFVQPSYFESFSLSLCEAWVQSRPALVQSRCDVLRGQAVRSGGGIPYSGVAEYAAALDLLLGDPHLQSRLGAAGNRYVRANYGWSTVLDRYEVLLEEVVRSAGEPNTAQESRTPKM